LPNTTSSGSTVTRNGLGARGIDRIERVNSSGTTVGYPLYDGHGNMVAMLGKSGSSYSLGDQRAYDAWGVIRQGATSGDPKGRYCANLGHVEDDESGLTCMRARYYEAASGRFISQDRKMDGGNWFVYCWNNPIKYFDESGNSKADAINGLIALLAGAVATIVGIVANAKTCATAGMVAIAGLICIIGWYCNFDRMDHQSLIGYSCYGSFAGGSLLLSALFGMMGSALDSVIDATLAHSGLEVTSVKDKAKSTVQAYALNLALFIEIEAIVHDFTDN